MTTPSSPVSARKLNYRWLFPAIIAFLLFIGNLASNLVASDLQPILQPYRLWVWVIFALALLAAVIMAIWDAKRAHAGISMASGDLHAPVQKGADVGMVVTGDANIIDIRVAGDVVGQKIVHQYPVQSPSALHQLPRPPTDFTGRRNELLKLAGAVNHDNETILGIQGMPGVGKTTLALRLADQLTSLYPDAQIYLDLKGTSPHPLSAVAVMGHIIHAYQPTTNLPEEEGRVSGLYRSLLHGQRTLLLLDNAAGLDQLAALVPPKESILLFTSRQHFVLPGQHVMDLCVLPSEDARQLLLHIAPRIGDQAESIATLCGYLPLALRLAGSALAARRDLSPKDYLHQLQAAKKRLELVEASFDLSYLLLGAEMQAQWRKLGVFPDTFDIAGAAAVWDIETNVASQALSGLVACSMVEWNEQAGRYRLHDLGRLLADSKMGEEERINANRLHACHYTTHLLKANELYTKGSVASQSGIQAFDREWINIRATYAWAKKHAADNSLFGQFFLIFFEAGPDLLQLRQPLRERIEWLESGLDIARRLGNTRVEAAMLGNIGNAYVLLGDPVRALEIHKERLTITRKLRDRKGEGVALNNIGSAYMVLGDLVSAANCYQERLIIAQELGNRRAESMTLGNLGMIYAALGDTPRAQMTLTERLKGTRELGDRLGEAQALMGLGRTYASSGGHPRALELFAEALAICREIGYRQGECGVLGFIGESQIAIGKTQCAVESLKQCLLIAREIGNRGVEGWGMSLLAMAFLKLGDETQARVYMKQVVSILEEKGCIQNPASPVNTANTYFVLGDIPNALEFYEHALATARKIGDRHAEAMILWNMSLACASLKDLVKAVAHAEEALKILREIKNPNVVLIQDQLAAWRGEIVSAHNDKTEASQDSGTTWLEKECRALSPDMQDRWQRLAVFPGSFDEDGAAAVWGLGADVARADLRNLVTHGILEWDLATRRYQLPGMARQIANAGQRASQRREARSRHAAWYVTMLGAADALFLVGGDSSRAASRKLDTENANIVAGQAWAQAEAATDDDAARLCLRYASSGVHIQLIRQHPRERIQWLDAALHAAQRLKDRRGEGTVLLNKGITFGELGDFCKASELFQQALVIIRETGERHSEALCLINYSAALMRMGDQEQGIELGQHALSLARELGDRSVEAAAIQNQGEGFIRSREFERAKELLLQCLTINREIKDQRSEGFTLGYLAVAYQELGDLNRAIDLYLQRLLIARDRGDRRAECITLTNLGVAFMTTGNPLLAIENYEQAQALCQEIGEKTGEVKIFMNLARAYFFMDQVDRALEFYNKAVTLAQKTGDRRMEGNALFMGSFALDAQGKRTETIIRAETALKIFVELSDPTTDTVQTQLAQWKETLQ